MQIDTDLINQVVEHVQRDERQDLRAVIAAIRYRASERLDEIHRAELLRRITQKDRDQIIHELAEDFAKWSEAALMSAAKVGVPALQDQETPELLRQYEEAFGEHYIPLAQRKPRWVALPKIETVRADARLRVVNDGLQHSGRECEFVAVYGGHALVRFPNLDSTFPVSLSRLQMQVEQ